MRYPIICFVLLTTLTLVQAGQPSSESDLPGQGLFERVMKLVDARLTEMNALEVRFRERYFNQVRDPHALRTLRTPDELLSELKKGRAHIEKKRKDMVKALEQLRVQRITLEQFNYEAVLAATASVSAQWKTVLDDTFWDQSKIVGDSRWQAALARETHGAEVKALENRIKNVGQLAAAKAQVEQRMTREEEERYQTYRTRYEEAMQNCNRVRENLAGELLEFKDYLMKRKMHANAETVSETVLGNFALGLRKSHPKIEYNSELDYAVQDKLSECLLVFLFYKGYPRLLPLPILETTRLDSLKREDSTPIKSIPQANVRLESVSESAIRGLNTSLDTLVEAPKRYAELRALISAEVMDVVKMNAAARDVFALKRELKGPPISIQQAQDKLAQAQKAWKDADSAHRWTGFQFEERMKQLVANIAEIEISIRNTSDEKMLEKLNATQNGWAQELTTKRNTLAQLLRESQQADVKLKVAQRNLDTAVTAFDRRVDGKWAEFRRLHDRVRDALPEDKRENLTSFTSDLSKVTRKQVEDRLEVLERRTAHLYPADKNLETLERAMNEFKMAAVSAKNEIRADVMEYLDEALELLDGEYARRSTPAARYPRRELAEVRSQIKIRTEMLLGRQVDPEFERLAANWDINGLKQQIETVRAALILTRTGGDDIPFLDEIMRLLESGEPGQKVLAWVRLAQYHGHAHVEWQSSIWYVRGMTSIEPAQRAISAAWPTLTTAPLDAFPNPQARLYTVDAVLSRHLYADETEKAAVMLTGLRLLNLIGSAPVR